MQYRKFSATQNNEFFSFLPGISKNLQILLGPFSTSHLVSVSLTGPDEGFDIILSKVGQLLW